jgi:O-antigen/teichoic acid export membrane protein
MVRYVWLQSYYQSKLGKGSFFRNASITSLWSAAIIAVQFLLSPVLTRIFSPGEYGQYGLFGAIASNIMLFSTLKFSEVVVLQTNRYKRQQAIALALLISIVISFVTAGAFAIAEGYVRSHGDFSYYSLFYFIPLSILLASCTEVLAGYNIHRKKFSLNGFTGFANNLGSRLVNIAGGLWYSPKAIVLVLGDIIGKLIGMLVQVFSFKNKFRRFVIFIRSLSFSAITDIARQYKSFPLYYLPSTILIGMSGYLPVYFLQWKYTSTTVGYYMLGNSMLEAFNRLMPYAFAPVFLQKAYELKSQSLQRLKEKTYQLFLVMLVLSTVIFSLVALFGEFGFGLLFGDSWRTAGSFAGILAIQNAFIFVLVVLSEIYNITGTQKILFRNTLISLSIRIVALLLIAISSFSEIQALLVYSLITSIGSLVYIRGVFSVLKYKTMKVVLWSLLCLMIICLCAIAGNFNSFSFN